MTTIIFDLDGTLIDTSRLVLPAFRETLLGRGLHNISDDVLMSTFGMTDEQIWQMLMPEASDRERLEAFAESEHYIIESLYRHDVLLPQARETLTALQSAGHQLTVASNCGQLYLDNVLDSQDIRRFFEQPLCLQTVAGKQKADSLTKHLTRIPKASSIMVGDRKSDVEAAHAHNVKCVGCRFTSFASEDELRDADYIITALPGLVTLLQSGEL